MERAKGGFFERSGFSLSQRKLLFTGVCIWVRLFLAYMITQYAHLKKVQYGILFFSMVSLYVNIKSLRHDVWWSRKVHASIAFAMCVYSILCIMDKSMNPKYLGYIFAFDVFMGISKFIETFYLPVIDPNFS